MLLNSVPLTGDPFQADADRKRVEQASTMRSDLLAAMDALDTIRQCISGQAAVLDGHIEACTVRRGFVSLPNEILSVVLEHAANEQYNTEAWTIVHSVQAATKLSHVCKRFRHLIVNLPGLWNRWTNLGKSFPGMLPSCILRSGNSGSKLLVSALLEEEFPEYAERIEEFLRIVYPKHKFWDHFVLNCRRWECHQFSDKELMVLAKVSNGVVVPSLTILDIQYHDVVLRILQERGNSLPAVHFYSTWSTPRLQSMVTKNFIPVPFSGSQSLKSLSLSIGFDTFTTPHVFDIVGLLSFLSSCPVVEDITLSVGGADSSVPSSSISHPVEMRFVSNLHLHVKLCNSNPLRLFFEHIRFPALSRLVFYIQTSLKNETSRDIEASSRKIIHAVFPNAEVFQNLSSMVLWVSAGRDFHTGFEPFVNLFRHYPPIPPASCVPKLRDLEISPPHGWELDSSFPAIETLVVRGLCYVECWIIPMLKLLESRGDLEKLQWVHFADGIYGLYESNPVTLSNDELRDLMK